MILNRIQQASKNPYGHDVLVTIFFGLLSIVLGMIKIQIPGVDGSYSDMREIALLIGLFHIKKPFFVILLSIGSCIGIPPDAPIIPQYLMHLIPLGLVWYLIQQLTRYVLPDLVKGLVWMIISFAYYAVLLYPILIVTYQWFGLNTSQSFTEVYTLIFWSGRFEVVATTLVSGFYLIQFGIRKELEHNNKNMEKIVQERTQELQVANEELQSLNEELSTSNDQITSLNDNLEMLVEERTDKINQQLQQLIRYAHMNSHEVRAPLARLLGLLTVMKMENAPNQQLELLGKVYENAEELDHIIRNMNRLLEGEIEKK